MINNLEDLIKNHGNPNILIDNWNELIGYAVWDFKNIILWDQSGLYISGKSVEPKMQNVQSEINRWKLKSKSIAAIGFINYNFKNIIYPHINFKIQENNLPYLVFINPKKIKKYNIKNHNSKLSSSLKLKSDILPIDSYCKIIKKIKDHLEYGNAYQINYTMLKKFEVSISPFELYLQLRDNIKPKFGYYFNFGDYDILSFSPEQFFKKITDDIYSYPMKGTIERDINIEKDKMNKIKLSNSEKDKAEHLMIVDLIRNDLGKICQYGSVKVENLFHVQSHDTVYQMVSCINGKIKNDIEELDIFNALFPGGSVTGAPKESAMSIIDSLENYNRNIYTGAIGYIDKNSDMNFNIPIRTMTIRNKLGEYPVGGGIVWDSDAINEWHEAQIKSKILAYAEKENK